MFLVLLTLLAFGAFVAAVCLATRYQDRRAVSQRDEYVQLHRHTHSAYPGRNVAVETAPLRPTLPLVPAWDEPLYTGPVLGYLGAYDPDA